MVAAPFRILTTTDHEASAPKEWIVDKILGAGEVSALVAPPTAGKSALALDLAAHISIRHRWFDRETAHGSALYFAPERGNVTLRRLRAFESFHQVRGINVGVVRDGLDLLKDQGDANRILDAVKAYEDRTGTPVKFVAIDTARAAMPGGDENSPRDMGRLVHNLRHIRDGIPGAHIQLLHHTPKGRPGEASGHTALTAMVDAVIVVGVAKGSRSWRIREANDLPTFPPPGFFELKTVNFASEEAPATAPVVVPILSASVLGRCPAVLPRDAGTALQVLRSLTPNGSPIDVERWREATHKEFGERAAGAKRQAFSSARRLLVQTGRIDENGKSVSVRIASE
jgi:AAA domain